MKKMKMFKKEEGFTLVELLAVIVILGVILAIAIPAVGNVISTAQKNADDREVELIISAARVYFTTEGKDEGTITVADLYTKGFLETAQDPDELQQGTVTKGKNPTTYSFDAD